MKLRATSSAIGSMAASSRRLRAMGNSAKPTAAASPWQNGCRTADRIGRTASTSDSAILRKLLQQHENPSLLEQGCSYLASYSANPGAIS
jgi:hypothetical protein